MNKKLIDLSHTVKHGMITYKGLPAPIICDFLSREDSRSHYSGGTEFHIGKITDVATRWLKRDGKLVMTKVVGGILATK